MYLVFMDESGDISFSEESRSKYFLITCLSIEEAKKNKMKNTMKKKKVKLYKKGWPRSVEIKAHTLHQLNHNRRLRKDLGISINGDAFIKEILTSVKNSYRPKIDYFVVDKERITDESFRNAEYGIAYNFFSGKLLLPLIKEFQDCKVFIDPRNKERHSKRHFEGYINTEIMKMVVDERIRIKCTIEQPDSHMNLGLQTVDFFSWSLNRQITYNDSRYYDLFSDLIDKTIRWYC